MITWAERAKVAIAQTGQGGTAKTDETAISRLLAASSVPTVAAPAMTERLSAVLTVLPTTVLEKHYFSAEVAEDPDRWCWPHSSAMNGGEINTFVARQQKFTHKGLTSNDGETLADRLVLSDRDEDDRRVCLECAHLSGFGQTSWRCGNWLAAGIAVHPRDTRLAADLVVQLQRCDGFTAHPTSTPQGTEDEHDRH